MTKTTITKTIKVAIAVILVVLVISLSLYGVISSLIRQNEREIALLTSLSKSGISANDLDKLLDACIGLLDGKTVLTNVDLQKDIFQALVIINEIGQENNAKILNSYINPSGSKKSIFSVFKYSSLMDKFKLLGEKVDELSIDLEENLCYTQSEVEASSRNAYSLVNRIVLEGYDRYAQSISIIKRIEQSENALEEVSIKDFYRVVSYAIDVSREINVGMLYLLDLFFGKEFRLEGSVGMDSVLVTIREWDYDKFISILTCMPDGIDLMCRVINELFIQGENDPKEVARAIEIILEKVFSINKQDKLEDGFVENTLNELIAISQDAENQQNRERAEQIINEVKKIILEEDGYGKQV